MNKAFSPVVFVGAGVFGEVLLKKALAGGFFEPGEVIATVRRQERAEQLRRAYGIRVEMDNLRAVTDSRVVLVCVRPQDVEGVARAVRGAALGDKLLVSVAAGVSLERLSDLFGTKQTLRANPNPQVEVGCGYTAIAASPEVDDAAKGWAKSLFDCAGETDLLDENALDAVSVLSGISHVLYFFEAMVDAGIYIGLPQQVSRKIAYHSISGAMKLLNHRKVSPSELIREATTPGGVSVEKLFVFENRGLKGILMEAMAAAKEKAGSWSKQKN